MIHKRLLDLCFAATGMTQGQLTQIAVRLHHSFVLAIAEPNHTAATSFSIRANPFYFDTGNTGNGASTLNRVTYARKFGETNRRINAFQTNNTKREFRM